MKNKKEKALVIKIGDGLEGLEKLKNPRNVDEFSDNIVYFKSFGQLASFLSDKKLELLQHLSQITGQTVTSIAIDLGRKKEAISRDLHELDNLGIIELQREGKKVYPKSHYQVIQIDLQKDRIRKKKVRPHV